MWRASGLGGCFCLRGWVGGWCWGGQCFVVFVCLCLFFVPTHQANFCIMSCHRHLLLNSCFLFLSHVST